MNRIIGILILIITTSTKSYSQAVRPKITQTPSSEEISIGSEVKFTCESSIGNTNCEWLKDDQPIEGLPTNNCEFVIQSYSTDSAGTYVCRIPQESDQDSEKITLPAIDSTAKSGKSGAAMIKQFELTYPKDTTGKQGDNMTLECKFPKNAVLCFWDKDGTPYVVGDPDPNSDRPHSIGDKLSGDCSIMIPSLAIIHDGWYKCGLPSSPGETEQMVSPAIKVTILHEPDLPHMEYNGEVVKNGEIRVPEEETNIIVQCIVKDGNPAAVLRWYKLDGTEIIGNVTVTMDNDRKLSTVINELNVPKSEHNQRAIASCNATHETYNTTNKMRSVTAILIQEGPVEEVVTIFSNSSETTLKIKLGEKVQMNCTVYAEPPPTYEWQRKSDSTADWTKFGDTKSTQDVKEKGEYKCGARNNKNIALKFSKNILKVEVEYPPAETLSAGAIFGIVFGVIVVIALVGWLVYYSYSRGKWCFKRPTTPSTRQVPMAEMRRKQESRPLRSEP